MSFLRKLVFYFFTLIFVVFCPLIVLYALGYIFKPHQEHKIIKSGLIYAATVPSGAHAVLAGKKLDQQTPALILDLMPGDYLLQLSLPGYKTWSQEIPVDAGKATVLDKILLLPEVFKTEILSHDKFRELIPFHRGNRLLLIRGEKLQEVESYDIKESKIRPVFRDSSNLPSEEKFTRVFTSLNSPFVIFEMEKTSRQPSRYLRVRADSDEKEVQDISSLLPENPERILWDSAAEHLLFALKDGSVTRVDLHAKESAPGFLNGVRGIGLFEKGVYVLLENHTLILREDGGEDRKPLSRDTELVQSLLGDRGKQDLRIFSRDLILFLGEDGRLVSNRLPHVHAERGVSGLEFYEGAFLSGIRKVLVWGEEGMGVLNFRKLPAEKEIFEKGIRLAWILKETSDIREAFWVYDGTHVLYREGDQVKILEIEGFGKSQIIPVTKVRRDSAVYYSEETGKVYFLEDEDGFLASLEILPRKKIQFFPFPDIQEEVKEGRIREV